MQLNKKRAVEDVEDPEASQQTKRIREENEFVKKLLNLIPVDVYFNKEDRQRVNINNASKKGKKDGKAGKKTGDREVTEMISELEVIETTEKELAAQEGKGKINKNKKLKQLQNKPKDLVKSYDQLHTKLEARIAELRGKRPNSEEWLEKRKATRKLSKLKKKKKKTKPNSGVEKGQKVGAGQTEGSGESSEVKKEEPADVKCEAKLPQEDAISYSSIVFSENGAKRKKGAFSGRNYSGILKRVEKDKSKIRAVEETDMEKAKRMKQKTAWKTAMQRAEGVKVKDDVELLKKAIQRKEQKKKKSQKAWAERAEQAERRVQKQEAAVKDKKMKRKQEKRKKGIKKAQKEGRYVQPF